MKLLLITLSILLTSSPLFGQETGVLYLWENGTKYMGEWKDGKRHGQGNMTYYDGSKFVGKWKDGKRHGQGNMTYHDGSKFVGKWKNGKRHGQGTYTWCFYCSWCSSLPGATNSSHPSSFADGRKYEGEWKDGVYHGHGTYTFSGGSKYEGEWKDWEKHGQGTYTFSDGRKYVGEYKDGKKNGQGTYTWNDGGKYVGEYKNGQKNGHGTYTFLNGDNFEGEWKEGEQDEGTHTWSNKYKYEGSWKSGQMWNGIYYDNKGNLFGKQVNGEQQYPPSKTIPIKFPMLPPLSLPEGWKEDLEGLEAIHDMGTFRNDFYREGGVDSVNSALKKVGSAVHKVIETHPISGLKYLNVNQSFTRNIVNESQGSSDHILQFLFKHMAKPEFQVRFYWLNNSVAIWDNRITQHYAICDYLPNFRHMHRITVINDKREK